MNVIVNIKKYNKPINREEKVAGDSLLARRGVCEFLEGKQVFKEFS